MKKCALSVAVALGLTGNVVVAQDNSDNSASSTAPQIEEVSVIGRYVPDEKRNTSALSSVLSAEEFSRSGDSNIAEGLKRVAGLSLVGGKFIYVRGLGERYSSALLNGSTLPSPEPMNRVVPLDLFPSAVMDSVVVQKTYSAEYPSEFGGGVLQMRTKRSTDEFFFNINSSLGVNEETTFRTGNTSSGGDRDWLGYDDGAREMPAELEDAIAGNTRLKRRSAFLDNGGYTQEELQTIGRSLPNNYALDEKSLPPDASVGASLGNFHDVGGVRINYLGALDYKNSWDHDEIERNLYASGSGDNLTPINEFEYIGTDNNIDISGIASTGIEFSPQHNVRATGILLRKTTDRNASEIGFFGADTQDVDITRLEYIEREMLSGQLEGDHYFPEASELTLNWRYNRSTATRDTPDTREYRYDLRSNGEYRFSTRADANVRRFSELDDDNTDYGFSASMVLAGPAYSDLTLLAGYNHQDNTRDYGIRRFTFAEQGNVVDGDFLFRPLEQILAPENIRPDGFELRETTRPTDAYAASREVDAWYAQAELNFADRLQLLAGVRREEYFQQVSTFDLFRPDTSVEARLQSEDYLPGITATLINGNHQFRLGYSQTTSRPDFRELSPANFTNPVTGREEVGNPDLQVTYIDNIDLRWEWYLDAVDSVSIGLFYKEFERPIESVIRPGANTVKSFINANSAENRGVEVEARKQLGFLGERWSNFYVSGNASFIDSEVSIGEEGGNILTNTSRPLQGQSDWLFNGQIGYDDYDGLTATLLYHYFGERIDEVGILGAPDLIEEGNGRLDLVLIKEFSSSWKVNLKASNLLDERREITQGGLVTTGYHDGRSASVKVEYQW